MSHSELCLKNAPIEEIAKIASDIIYQEKVEKMALEINAKLSTMMGVWFTFMIGFLMLSLVTIGVLQTVSENGSKTGEIAGLSVFTLLWGAMFV